MKVANEPEVIRSFSQVARDLEDVRKSIKDIRGSMNKLESKTLEFPERAELFEYINRLDKSLNEISEKVVSKVLLDKFQIETKQRFAFVIRRINDQEDMSIQAARVRKFQEQIEEFSGRLESFEKKYSEKSLYSDEQHKKLLSEITLLNKKVESFTLAIEKAQGKFEASVDRLLDKQLAKYDSQIASSLQASEKKLEKSISMIALKQEESQDAMSDQMTSASEKLRKDYETDIASLRSELAKAKKALSEDKSLFAERNKVEILEREIEEVRLNYIRDIDFNKDLTKINIELQDMHDKLDQINSLVKKEDLETLKNQLSEQFLEQKRHSVELEALKARIREDIATNQVAYKEMVQLNERLTKGKMMPKALLEQKMMGYEHGQGRKVRTVLYSVFASIMVIAILAIIYNWFTGGIPALNTALWIAAIGAIVMLILLSLPYERMMSSMRADRVEKEQVSVVKEQKKQKVVKEAVAKRSKQKTSGLGIFSTVLNWIFVILLLAFVLLIIANEFVPVPYVNFTYLLIALAVVGLIAYLFQDPAKKYKKSREYVSLLLGIGCAFYIYTRIRDLGWIAYLLTVVSFVIIVLLAMFFLSSEDDKE